jgi:hypothetical protein
MALASSFLSHPLSAKPNPQRFTEKGSLCGPGSVSGTLIRATRHLAFTV